MANPRDGAEPSSQRISQDRQHHCALTADVVGDDATHHAAGGPAGYRARQDVAGILRDRSVLRWIEQLTQRKADGEEDCVDLETVEQPAEIGCEEHSPLLAAERAVPRYSRIDGVCLLDLRHGAVSLSRDR